MVKGLSVNIFTDKSRQNCTLEGSSSQAESIVLVGEGVSGANEVEIDQPYLKVVRRKLFGGVYIHAIPMINGEEMRPKGSVGGMFGGDFIYSSDSRFREVNNYPIPVHDRYESQRLYNQLSK